MKIFFTDDLALRLMTIANAAAPQEFSGFCFSTNIDGDIWAYDFVLLDIGSWSFTEIPTGKILKLMERPDAANMKGWLHRHPLGDGKPGPHNWSGTDENTIQTLPLGGVPELVGWSWSVVLTPKGWVGRIDNHKKHTTKHLEVFPQFGVYDEVAALMPRRGVDPLLEIGEIVEGNITLEMLDELGITPEEYLQMVSDSLYEYVDPDPLVLDDSNRISIPGEQL